MSLSLSLSLSGVKFFFLASSRKWPRDYGCSKEFVQSAALHWNDSTGKNSSHEGEVTGGNNFIADGQNSHEV